MYKVYMYMYMIGINHVLNHLSPPDFAPIHLGAIYINIYFNPSRTDIYRYIYIYIDKDIYVLHADTNSPCDWLGVRVLGRYI